MLRRASITALLFAFACGMATPAMAQTTNGVIARESSDDAQGGVLPGVTGHGTERRYRRHDEPSSPRRTARFAWLASLPRTLRAEGRARRLQRHGDVPALTREHRQRKSRRNVTMQVQDRWPSPVTVHRRSADRRGDDRATVSGVITQEQMQMPAARRRAAADGSGARHAGHQPRCRCARARPNSNIRRRRFTNGSALLGRRRVEQGRQHRASRAWTFRSRPSRSSKVFVSQSPARIRLDGGRRGVDGDQERSDQPVPRRRRSSSTVTRRSTRMDPFALAPGSRSRTSAGIKHGGGNRRPHRQGQDPLLRGGGG